MKTKLIAASILLTSISVSANAEDTRSTTEFCTEMSSVAETILKKRYEGVSAASLYKVAEDNGISSLKQIINMAFDRPNYTTSENQSREVRLFRDEIFMLCVEVVDEA